jgi:uncharacterized protein (TIGR03083 family)
MTGATLVAAPRTPVLERDTAMRLAATEYDRFVGQLRRLSDEDWRRQTECPGWTVTDMTAHVLGMAEMAASIPEQIRQTRAAGKAGGSFLDALTALQVDKHRMRSPRELIDLLAVVGPKAAKGRRRTPALIRRRRMSPPQDVGGVEEVWTIGFLVDVILTRDTWMHRVDIARATGRDPELTAEHDGRLVADVAAEWAQRHGRACTLTLTGPAGGTWSFAGGGAAISMVAVEFCRGLSGRGEPALGTEVPF